jgi:hypothetical protein
MKDPIVEEVHKTRAKIARSNNYDIRRISNYFREKESKQERVITSKREIKSSKKIAI